MGEVLDPVGATSRLPDPPLFSRVSSGARSSLGPPLPRARIQELVCVGRFAVPAVSRPHSGSALLCCSLCGAFRKPAASFSVPPGHSLIAPGGPTTVCLSGC
ncbi:hypothetical protein NDU88_005762 [Pleurodeles waltl]|uniref:Uncharacterized protein n=1 Tax=Pleurodeles waltl TaxID=8319 RepID=A0AAV7RQ59_PLEWA|nr:hypothetical protein NDU88_005762 [Pleurodeles waltl]